MSANVAADPIGLERALHELGVPCHVEMRDRLAVLRPAERAGEKIVGLSFADDALRHRVVALSMEHGFTAIALELEAPDARA